MEVRPQNTDLDSECDFYLKIVVQPPIQPILQLHSIQRQKPANTHIHRNPPLQLLGLYIREGVSVRATDKSPSS
jgi:hypothetical protein